MRKTFISTKLFDRMWERMNLTQEDLSELENILLENPDAGDVIKGLDGARKIRIPLERQGKSGGGRVIYVDVVIKDRIYFLYAYPKNMQSDLTPIQEKTILSVIEAIREAIKKEEKNEQS